jgi:acyl carrier protein
MAAFRDLVTRARALSLRSSELADPTCTVTSLGEQGVEGVHGVIFPPQLAIVGFGTVVERPWARRPARRARPARHALRRPPRERRARGRQAAGRDRPPAAGAGAAVTREEITAAVHDALADVAPEVDPARLSAERPLRDQADLDSMDFLSFLIGVSQRLGVEIPEADYGRLESVDAIVDYVAARRAT